MTKHQVALLGVLLCAVLCIASAEDVSRLLDKIRDERPAASTRNLEKIDMDLESKLSVPNSTMLPSEAPTRSAGASGAGAPTSCHFPFEYQGKTYDSCTTVDNDQPWCMTNLKTRTWINCGAPTAPTMPPTIPAPVRTVPSPTGRCRVAVEKEGNSSEARMCVRDMVGTDLSKLNSAICQCSDKSAAFCSSDCALYKENVESMLNCTIGCSNTLPTAPPSTLAPTETPTSAPSLVPTEMPSATSQNMSDTSTPTESPTSAPTLTPTDKPSMFNFNSTCNMRDITLYCQRFMSRTAVGAAAWCPSRCNTALQRCTESVEWDQLQNYAKMCAARPWTRPPTLEVRGRCEDIHSRCKAILALNSATKQLCSTDKSFQKDCIKTCNLCNDRTRPWTRTPTRPWTRPPTLEAQNSSNYEIRTSGQCSVYITSSNDCAQAAAEFGLSDVTVTDDRQMPFTRGMSRNFTFPPRLVTYDPPGCYMEMGSLKMNVDGTNVGPCTPYDACICRRTVPMHGANSSATRTFAPFSFSPTRTWTRSPTRAYNPNVCQDRISRCKVYLARSNRTNYCATSRYFQSDCRKTCNLCNEPTPCVDRYSRCKQMLARTNRTATYCTEHPTFPDNCRKTCNLCGSGNSTMPQPGTCLLSEIALQCGDFFRASRFSWMQTLPQGCPSKCKAAFQQCKASSRWNQLKRDAAKCFAAMTRSTRSPTRSTRPSWGTRSTRSPTHPTHPSWGTRSTRSPTTSVSKMPRFKKKAESTDDMPVNSSSGMLDDMPADDMPADDMPASSGSGMPDDMPADDMPANSSSGKADDMPADDMPVSSGSGMPNDMPADDMPVNSSSSGMADDMPADDMPVSSGSGKADDMPADDMPVSSGSGKADDKADDMPADDMPVSSGSGKADDMPAASTKSVYKMPRFKRKAKGKKPETPVSAPAKKLSKILSGVRAAVHKNSEAAQQFAKAAQAAADVADSAASGAKAVPVKSKSKIAAQKKSAVAAKASQTAATKAKKAADKVSDILSKLTK